MNLRTPNMAKFERTGETVAPCSAGGEREGELATILTMVKKLDQN